MLGGLMGLGVRALKPIAVVLRAVCCDVEGLTLQLLGTDLLIVAVASNELRAARTLKLWLLAWVFKFFLTDVRCGSRT